jgi:hypothetical protein
MYIIHMMCLPALVFLTSIRWDIAPLYAGQWYEVNLLVRMRAVGTVTLLLYYSILN